MGIRQKDFASVVNANSRNASDAFNQGAEDSRADKAAALKKYLQGQEQGTVADDGTYKPGAKALAQKAEQDRNIDTVKSFLSGKAVPGRKLTMHAGDVGASDAETLPNPGIQKAQDHNIEAYSKRLEKYSDAHGALQDLERITNRDGKGGIFTNPDAKLLSGGQIESKIPDSALGAAEFLGAVPKGTAEERKAIARYKLSMGHALTGARMNPAMQSAISDSMGAMASGDPELLAKGLRGSAGIIGSQVRTVQSGYPPQVRDTVHETLGGDPMEFYNRIPQSGGQASGAQQPQQAAPQGAQQAPQGAPQTKRGKDGKTYTKNPQSGLWEAQ